MNNKISVYRNNSKTLKCSVTGDITLSDFTAYLTIKKDVNNDEPLIELLGEIIDNLIIFELKPDDTFGLDIGKYYYDIVLENEIDFFTIVKDDFIILENVRFFTPDKK